jgi:hypothetical protein
MQMCPKAYCTQAHVEHLDGQPKPPVITPFQCMNHYSVSEESRSASRNVVYASVISKKVEKKGKLGKKVAGKGKSNGKIGAKTAAVATSPHNTRGKRVQVKATKHVETAVKSIVRRGKSPKPKPAKRKADHTDDEVADAVPTHTHGTRQKRGKVTHDGLFDASFKNYSHRGFL